MVERRTSVGLMVTIVVAWIVVGFLIAPMFVVIPFSLSPERYLSMPSGELSLRHYKTVFTDSAWLGALADSTVVGVGAMVIATLVGASAAIGLWQLGRRGARIVGALALMPLIIPPIVTAMALSRAWVALGLFDTKLGVIVSHAMIGIPFVFMTVTAALDGSTRGSRRRRGVWAPGRIAPCSTSSSPTFARGLRQAPCSHSFCPGMRS